MPYRVGMTIFLLNILGRFSAKSTGPLGNKEFEKEGQIRLGFD